MELNCSTRVLSIESTCELSRVSNEHDTMDGKSIQIPTESWASHHELSELVSMHLESIQPSKKKKRKKKEKVRGKLIEIESSY